MSDFSKFDPKQTLALVRGSLFNHKATVEAYRQSDPDWKLTLVTLTLPVVIAAVVLGAILSWAFGSTSIYGMTGGVGMFFATLLWAILAVFILAFVAAFLAGSFGGVNHFSRAFGLASLVGVVGYAGSILGTLPYLGWLLSLAIGIYALVLFYRGLPVFLEVPDNKRTVHFVSTIVAVLVLNMVLSLAFGPRVDTGQFGRSASGARDSAAAPGLDLFGIGGQQVGEAVQDTFDPPADGKLSDAQVRQTIRFMQRTSEIQKEIVADLEKAGEKADAGVGDVMAGIRGVTGLSTAEMKVVKDNGGNWAEHQWVKQQLAMARRQQDMNETSAHNYALYQKYQEELSELAIY